MSSKPPLSPESPGKACLPLIQPYSPYPGVVVWGIACMGASQRLSNTPRPQLSTWFKESQGGG